MSWWRFWHKDDEDPAGTPEPAARPTQSPTPRPQRRAGETPDPTRARRLSELQRRRQDALYDVEQGELALAPDNPWTARIALLTDTLATVETDRRALADLPPVPAFPLLPTPIRELRADVVGPGGAEDGHVTVAFRIGDERFRFREAPDWDQRGGPTVRGDLRLEEGDPAVLLPAETPPDRRAALAEHLADSLYVFATDLRDRALSGAALPEAPTLADLAQPCPECGGWRDWRGRCPECARRDLRRQALRAEARRIEGERTAAAEERHRLADRLPIARRRLAQIDAEIAALGG